MSTIETNTVKPISGSSTLTLGESGDTVALGSGASSSGFGASLTGSTNNTVVTVTGANAMQGEANVTYADPKLMVANSGDSTFEIQSGNSSQCRLNFGDTDSSTIGQIRYTHSDNTMKFEVNGSERMRIDNSGNILLTKTNTNFGANGGMITDGGEKITLTRDGNGELCFVSNFINTNGYHSGMYYSGTLVGSIYQTHASTTFNTSSDYRLKENKEDVVDGIERLKQLKPYKFNWKSDPNEVKVKVDGFYAHEVSPVVPEAITGEKDAVDEEGNIIPQQIDQSKLVPLLTSALQEAITKIETLEAKVAALESA